MTDTVVSPPLTRIPRELGTFLGEVDPGKRTGTIPVGFPGKIGVVELTLAPDARSADLRTGFVSRYIKAPMYVSRPLYIDSGDRGEAFVYLRSTGGGLASNDRVRQDLVFEPGARATVTTQAATPVQRMDEGIAIQWTTLDVRAGAVCEYVPGQTILFGGSRLLQITDALVEPGGTLLAADIVMTGRLARGERNEFDAFGQVWTVRQPRGSEDDGRRGSGRSVPLLSDTLCVTGTEAESEMLMSRYPVWGTVLVVPPEKGAVPNLVAELRGAVASADQTAADSGEPEVEVGVSTLVDETGVMVRVAGNDPVAVEKAVGHAYSVARTVVLGRPAVDLRRM